MCIRDSLGTEFQWAERPVWVLELNGVLITDFPNNKAHLWTEKDRLQLFLLPSGITNHAPNSINKGANGLTLDSTSNLIFCQHGNRDVSKLKSWSFDSPDYEVLVDHFQGKLLNSPNNLDYNKDGVLFFTDPPYGLKDQDQDSIKELDFNGITAAFIRDKSYFSIKTVLILLSPISKLYFWQTSSLFCPTV